VRSLGSSVGLKVQGLGRHCTVC